MQARRVSGQVLYRELKEAEQAELSAAGVDAQARPWTDDELAVVLDRLLSRREAARRLGRTVNAVRRRRVLHKAQDQPVPDDLHGTLHAYGVYGCRCEPCQRAQRDRSSQRRY